MTLKDKLKRSVNLYRSKFSLIIFFCFIVTSLIATPTITFTVTPGQCPANGSITVNATGTTGGSVFYAIKKTTDTDFSQQQASNIFYNLESATYIFAVYDGSGTTISNQVTLKNADYITMSSSSVVSGNAVITGCDDDGSIVLTIAGGTSPYKYHLKGGPTTVSDINTTAKKVTFSQLSTGTYSIDVTDACGNTFTVPGIAVESKYNISSYDLKSFELQAPTLTSTGCDLRMYFPSNNSLLIAEDGTVLFWRTPAPSKYIPTGYPLKMKIEYPSGSGQYLSDWHTINPTVMDIIPNYTPTSDPKSNKYRILVKHPCNPNDTVFSPEYTFASPFVSKNGSCSPIIEHAYPTYDCGAVNIKITNKSNASITRSYVWDDHNANYPLDVTDLAAGSYYVSITTAGGFTYASNDVIIGTPPTINTAYIYNYISTLGCDFATGGFRVYGITAGDTLVNKTYTIVSGPVTRPPIIGAKDMNLWTDLPAGTYQIKIQYGDNCGSVIKNLTLTMPYSGFQSGALSYLPADECGKYYITGPAWYLAPNGTPATTSTYVANIYNSSGTFIAYYTANSNQSFISGPLDPGTYKITYQSSAHSLNICSYTQAERYITIPPYKPLAVDVPNSGGIVCQGGTGDLHIATTGGSGKAITYRVKPKGAPDTEYVEQASPNFPNRAAGEYTVQVLDACGYTTTQNITMIATTTAAEVYVSGVELASGSVTQVCPTSDVTLGLKIIGNASNVKWKYPDGTEVLAKTVTIVNFSIGNEGTYTASYTSGSCSWESSITLHLKPTKPEFSYNNAFSLCPSESVDLTALTPSAGNISGLTLSYWNNDYSEEVTPTAQHVQFVGTYHIVGVNQYACSDTSDVYVSGAPATTTWIAKGNPNNWNDAANWDKGVPAHCSNVIIPPQSTFVGVASPHYPILQPANGSYPQAVCDTITFLFGGEVAKTNYLNYNFAKVDMTLKPNQWYMVSPALQHQYSGDYQEAGSQYRINPEVYIMYYQTGNPEVSTTKVNAKFTGFFNTTDELLKICSGHALWVDNGVRAESNFTFQFPKDSTLYNYYSKEDNRVVRTSGIMDRDKRGRFIYEGNPSYQANNDGTFTQVIENSLDFSQVIIGNPYMSHLDIVEFQKQNNAYLGQSFRIWKGASYETYQIQPDGTIVGTDNDFQVPPLQSFIIDSKQPFANSLSFTPAMSITQPGKTLRSAISDYSEAPYSQSILSGNILRLEILKDNVRQSGIALQYKSGAGSQYRQDKDVWTIIPQSIGDYVTLYALVSGGAASIHTTGDVTSPLSLGISVGSAIKKTVTNGKAETYTIRISPGSEDRWIDKDVYLYDSKNKTTHNLTELPYEFSNTTGDITGRFQLFARTNSATGLEDLTTANSILIGCENSRIRVSSTPEDPIRQISVFDLVGKQLYSVSNLNVSDTSFDFYSRSQIVIVKVETSKNNKTQKLKVSED